MYAAKLADYRPGGRHISVEVEAIIRGNQSGGFEAVLTFVLSLKTCFNFDGSGFKPVFQVQIDTSSN